MKLSMQFLLAMSFAAAMFFVACSTDAEDKWDAAEVCPAEGMNAYGMPNRGTFVDERDGYEYKYTTIGNQVWMAENLQLKTEYSECYEYAEDMTEKCARYDNREYLMDYCRLYLTSCETTECYEEEFCKISGRYYNLVRNQEEYGLLDRVIIDTLCPKGWHVPTKDEWIVLAEAAGGADNRETEYRLRSDDKSFFTATFAGTNDCGFSAKPMGSKMRVCGSSLFSSILFGTSTSETSNFICLVSLAGDGPTPFGDARKVPIRCVKD